MSPLIDEVATAAMQSLLLKLSPDKVEPDQAAAEIARFQAHVARLSWEMAKAMMIARTESYSND